MNFYYAKKLVVKNIWVNEYWEYDCIDDNYGIISLDKYQPQSNLKKYKRGFKVFYNGSRYKNKAMHQHTLTLISIREVEDLSLVVEKSILISYIFGKNSTMDCILMAELF